MGRKAESDVQRRQKTIARWFAHGQKRTQYSPEASRPSRLFEMKFLSSFGKRGSGFGGGGASDAPPAPPWPPAPPETFFFRFPPCVG